MRRTTAFLGLLAVVLMGGPALAEPAPGGEARQVCSADRDPGPCHRATDDAKPTSTRAASQGDEVVAVASDFSIFAPPVRGSANVRVGGTERPGRRL